MSVCRLSEPDKELGPGKHGRQVVEDKDDGASTATKIVKMEKTYKC